MKDITKLKRELEKYFAHKFCGIDDVSNCKKEKCTCAVAAETQAYIRTIIPGPYYKFNIKNFEI